MIDLGPPPLDVATLWTPPKPAIIRALPPTFRVRIGEQYGTEAVEYHEWSFPRDIREATIEEAMVYLPEHLREQMPWWALERLLPLGLAGIPGMPTAVSADAAEELVKTVVFLTTTSGSNQTWDVLADWNSADNLVETIASGASGGVSRGASSNSVTRRASGGGGGGYSGEPNITLTPSGSATYRLSDGGPGVATSGANQSINGNNGADAWFNGTTLAGASVGAKGGLAGVGDVGNSSTSGGDGGASDDGVGTTKTSGGRGGNLGSTSAGARASGGGGAGGPTSNGGNGGDSGSATVATSGGDGGSPNGGSGSSGSTSTTGSTAGGSGTTFQSGPNRGTGGGSGARVASETNATRTSGAGGNFGGGSGGAATRNTGGTTGNATSGNGGPALIVITNNASL